MIMRPLQWFTDLTKEARLLLAWLFFNLVGQVGLLVWIATR